MKCLAMTVRRRARIEIPSAYLPAPLDIAFGKVYNRKENKL